MGQTVTIAELDAATAEWIRREAQRTGLPIEEIARQLIYRGLEAEYRKARQQRHHDLDALAGTWSAEDAEEFRQAIVDLGRIDPTLWE